MIFVTVGTQLPFPRLLNAVLELVRSDSLGGEEVILQTGGGDTSGGDVPEGVMVFPTMTPSQFNETFARARLIVGHAGIGTVLSAHRFGKPLVLLPRVFAKGEHRNDHQVATARQIEGRPGLRVVWNTDDMKWALTWHDAPPLKLEASPTLERLRSELRSIVFSPRN